MGVSNKWGDQGPEAFLLRIVTGDETWLYQYDPEDGAQPKQWLPRGGRGAARTKAGWSRAKVKSKGHGGSLTFQRAKN